MKCNRSRLCGDDDDGDAVGRVCVCPGRDGEMSVRVGLDSDRKQLKQDRTCR